MASSDVPFIHNLKQSGNLGFLYSFNGSDKELNDWILDEELMNPLTIFGIECNSGEQLLATGEKE